MKIFKTKKKGQALITLLFFTVMALMISTSAVAIISSGSISTGNLEQEEIAYYTAESGIENAILKLLRDPNYTGETMNINGGTATIQVSGSAPFVISSTGKIGNIKHIIEANVSYNNYVLTVTRWKQIY